MRIDSHHHFWKFNPQQYPWIDAEKAVLQRDFEPSDLGPLVAAAGIDGVVSVQARQTLEETAWLLEVAEQHAWVAGVVGWVPLRNPSVVKALAQFADRPLLKGIRHVVQDEPDDRFLLDPDFNRGIQAVTSAGLVYDILILAQQLPAAVEFVDRHPDQVFVLDHIAKPTIRGGAFDTGWEAGIKELAQRAHVHCKFSGVVTEVADPEWTIELVRPYWEVTLDAFGVDRLLFGSDWPVCLLRSAYDRWIKTVETLAGELSASEQAAFWGQNARRLYRLA